MFKTRFLLFFLFLQAFFLSAQDRNEKVRNLNEVVNLITINSNLNNKYYYDALYFTIAIVDFENNKNNFFKTFKGNFANNALINSRLLDFNIKAIGGNSFINNQLKDKIYSLKKINTLLSDKNSYLSSLKIPIENYLNKTDSLVIYRNQIIKYLKKKKYKKDTKLLEARKILSKNKIYFEQVSKASDAINTIIETIYLTQLPLNETQIVIKNAAIEMELTTKLLSSWQKRLFFNDNSFDQQNAKEIQMLFENGIAKDSTFFSTSKYYSDNFRNLSINPANQYLDFYYGSTILTTFDKFSNKEIFSNYENYGKTSEDHEIPSFLNRNYCRYNDFIALYNLKINSYNKFIAFADPLFNLKPQDFEIAKKYLDINQNAMLLKPELMYRYEFIDSTFVEKPSLKLLLSDKGKIENAVPHHLIYLLDASSSMKEENRLNRLKENTKYIVDFQQDKDRISIISFAEGGTVILKNEPCSDKISIHKKIDSITAGGATNVNQGALVAIDLALNNKLETGKTTLILITDGVFEMNKLIQEKLKTLNENKIDFCIIYIGPAGNKVAELKFKAITEKANGRFYTADEKNLRTILVKEASE